MSKMSKEKKIYVGWTVTNEEHLILSKIAENYRYRTLSQVVYNLMYSFNDLNSLLAESNLFAEKQKNNLIK